MNPPHAQTVPVVTPPAGEDDAALCDRYEAQEAEAEAAECLSGCDYPEGALSTHGCRW